MRTGMIKFDLGQIVDTFTRAEAMILDDLFDDGFDLFIVACDGVNDLDDCQDFLAAKLMAERILREVVLPNMDVTSRPFTDEEIQ